MGDPKNINQWFESLLTALKAQHQSLFNALFLVKAGWAWLC